MMGEIQQSIWEQCAVKRRQFYLAGFFIGALGALMAAIHHADQGLPLWSVPSGAHLESAQFGCFRLWRGFKRALIRLVRKGVRRDRSRHCLSFWL